LWTGLVRLGYREQADALAERLLGTIVREGLREYYDPFTGTGMGAHSFAWSALALELLEDEPLLAKLTSPHADETPAGA
jgi:hypothetical protein